MSGVLGSTMQFTLWDGKCKFCTEELKPETKTSLGEEAGETETSHWEQVARVRDEGPAQGRDESTGQAPQLQGNLSWGLETRLPVYLL